MRVHATVIGIVSYAMVLAGSAFAQCGIVLQEDTTVPGDVRGFRSHLEYDFDGPGPLAPELLVGADKGRVFAFNGTRWRQLGGPMIDPGAVYSEPNDPGVYHLFVFQGALHAVAAGYISSTNGSIFRWNGSAWVPVSRTSGCGSGSNAISGWFLGATIHNDEIIVVGQSLRCGNQNATALAWNGSSWRRVGDSPFDSTSVFGAALSTSNGRLILGGSLTRTLNFQQTLIVELVNNIWETRLTGLPSDQGIAVRRFQEIGGVVHALGAMSPITVGPPCYALREAATGWDNIFPLDTAQRNSMAVAHQILDDGDNLFIAGGVSSTGAGSIVLFDPLGFHVVVPTSSAAQRFSGGIARFQGRYMAFGGTTAVTSCSAVPALLTASAGDPFTWSAIPALFSPLSASTVQPVGVVLPAAAGTFAAQGDQSTSLGVLRPSQCFSDATTSALRQGGAWLRPVEVLNAPARHLIQYNNEVIALGSFSSAGSRGITQGIARWDGAAWQSFPQAITPAGAAITYGVVWNNSLVVADNRGTSLTVRRFDGAAWSALGAAMTSSGTPTVAAIGTRLFVAFGRTVNEWNGTAWTRLGTDATTPQINRIGTFGPDPVLAAATGPFRWDGTTWATLGTFTPAGTPQIRAIVEFNGTLYAGLSFASLSYSPVMRLDGGQWTRAASNTALRPNSPHASPTVFDLAAQADTLYVAGQFDLFGGFANESVARLYMGLPRVLTPPAPAGAVIGRTAYFSIEPEVYHDVVQTYRWSRDGIPLADGPTASGSTIVGSGTPYLRIEHAATTDVGQYAVAVMNACGTTTTAAAGLTLSCPADFDDGSGLGTPDGGVGIEDLLYYLDIYDAGVVRADLDDGTATGTQDGGVGIEDLLYFLARYDAGC